MRRSAPFALSLLGLIWPMYCSAVNLPDYQATAIIEETWNRPFRLAIGELVVVSGVESALKSDVTKRKILQNEVPLYELLEKHGLVQLTEQHPTAGGSSNGIDQAPDPGISAMTVAPTQKALTLEKRTGKTPEAGAVWLPEGKFVVTKIVSNEPETKGLDQYRVVVCAYDAVWDPEWKALLEEAQKQTVSSQRKAVVLLYYDPNTGRWSVVTQDLANTDAPFATSHVKTFMQLK